MSDGRDDRARDRARFRAQAAGQREARRLALALERGCRSNDENAKGEPHKLIIGDRLPEDTDVLPPPEALAGVLHGCGIAGGDSAPPPPAA